MKNMKKKSKIGLSAAAGLLAASGSIAPLTMATSCDQTQIKNSIIDKEYGVSKETYDDLKNQFRVAYSQKLKKDYDIGSNDYKIRMDALEQDLANFDNVVNQKNTSYTPITQALVDFAREQQQKYPTGNATETEPYGIQLVRHTRTKWSDLNDLYAGMADSFKTYMHNSKMPASTINRIMAESKAKFDNLTKQLKATYGNDALSGLIQAKTQMITFFDEVNEEIGLISSCLRLKDFMSEFVFEYKDYNDDGTYYMENRLDKLMNDDNFKEGNILTNGLMNKIFKITRKTTDKTVPFDAKTLVPGYTIQPKLTKINEDPASNTYSISIDFGLVKNVYAQRYAKDPEKLASLTAHMYNLSNENFLKTQTMDDNTSIVDFLKTVPVQSLEYAVRLSPLEEAKRLEAFYFNHEAKYGYISFNWTNDKAKQAYECFFDSAKQDKNNPNKWTGVLTTQSLINAGLTISKDGNKYTLVSDGGENLNNFLSDNFDIQGVFLQNCTLLSYVEINEGDQRIVNHNFKVVYSNSIYQHNSKDESPVFNIKSSDYNNQCIDFNVSSEFYEKINDKFNNIAHLVLVYNATLKNTSESQNGLSKEDEAKLFKLEKEANLLYIGEEIALINYLITLGLSFVSIISAWTTSKSKFWLWFGIIVDIIILGFECANFSLFKKYYFNKVENDVKKVRNAQQEMDESTLMAVLKQDLKDNFVLINDDGTYDKVKYAQQKAKFEKNSMADMLNMYRKYATIQSYSDDIHSNTPAQNAMKQFDDILSKKNITVEDIENDVKEWRPGGKFFIATLTLSIGIIVLNILSIFIYDRYIAKKRPTSPENKISQANDEAIMTSANATQSSGTSLVSTDDVIKSLKGNKALKLLYDEYNDVMKRNPNMILTEARLARSAIYNFISKAIFSQCRSVYDEAIQTAREKGDEDEITRLTVEYLQTRDHLEQDVFIKAFGLKPQSYRGMRFQFMDLDDSFTKKMDKFLNRSKWWWPF